MAYGLYCTQKKRFIGNQFPLRYIFLTTNILYLISNQKDTIKSVKPEQNLIVL
jgi:hypothetical protein